MSSRKKIPRILQVWVGLNLPSEHLGIKSEDKSAFYLFSKFIRIWLIHPIKRRAAKYWLKYLKRFHGLKVIGITGSVGKTTTKEMTHSVLSQKFNTVSSYKNEDPVYNIPTTILKCRFSTEFLVLEMGIEYPGEMVFYTWIAKPDYAILGKIDWVHSEFIGGIDKVFKEKSKLIDNLDKDGCAILNIDDKRVGGLAKKVKVDVVTTSTEKKADFKAENIQIDNDFNTRFIVNYDDKKYKFTIPLPGEHLVDSALFSLALGSLVGVGVDDIKKGIENFENEPHRMNPYKIKGNIHIIDDTYNANPTSVKGAINAFLKIAQNRRKILVIGDMRELGAYEKKGHREIGKYIANNEVDILITLGKLAEIIAKSAIISGANKNNVFITQDINKTTALLKNKLKKDDIVLIKGSRSMNMDSIVRQFV